MKNRTTFIDAGSLDLSRPTDRPAKTNRKVELIKKGLRAFQYVSPDLTSKVIWHYSTKPGAPRFSDSQKSLIERAQVKKLRYNKHEIVSYRWGNEGPKVLLAHGWRSKTADFRRIVEALIEHGYVVEGIDMKAHGQSSGAHTSLPEFRDILKSYYVKNAPYHAVIGYSMGGIASGIALSEISPALHPKQLFLLAAPSHVHHFFKSTVKDVGCEDKIYDRLCNMVEENYGESIEYFDLRSKIEDLNHSELHLIYDENDQMVPFETGKELNELFGSSHFVHTKGIGHYRIIAHQAVVDYLIAKLNKTALSFA